MRNVLFWLAASCATIIVGFFVLCAGFTWLLEVPFVLALGWVPYLSRVLPQLRPDPWTVGTAITCVIGVTLGTHAFLKWLYAATSDEPRRWRWQWSLQLVGLVVLVFVAGIAFTGMVHQTSWLARSPEPLFRGSRDGTPRMYSANNLKQIGIAAWNYHDSQKSPQFPRSQFNPTGQSLHSWQTVLLPYLEQDTLYKQIDLTKPWNDPANAMPMSQQLRVFMHPSFGYDSVNGFGVSHYAGNVHVVLSDRPKHGHSFPMLTTENVILAGEVSGNFRAWGDPLNARDPALGSTGHPHGFGGPYGKPAQFVMLDGSVRTIDPTQLAELLGKVPE
jgi:Protein of unknown function (DUF1559)